MFNSSSPKQKSPNNGLTLRQILFITLLVVGNIVLAGIILNVFTHADQIQARVNPVPTLFLLDDDTSSPTSGAPPTAEDEVTAASPDSSARAADPAPTASTEPTQLPTATSSPAPTDSPALSSNPASSRYATWRGGFDARCITTTATPTVQSGQRPVFQDLTGCEESGIATEQVPWILAFHSERGYGEWNTCRNFPAINDPTGPVYFEWRKRDTGNYTMRLMFFASAFPTDPVNCPADDYWNWYVVQAPPTAFYTGHNPPRPDLLVTHHRLVYRTEKDRGDARLITAFAGQMVVNGQEQKFSIEIGLNTDLVWESDTPGRRDPVIARCSYDQCGSNHVFVDGSFFGYYAEEDRLADITINWPTVYSYLIGRGLLPSPDRTDDEHLSTLTIATGFEVHSQINSGYEVDLTIEDFAYWSVAD